MKIDYCFNGRDNYTYTVEDNQKIVEALAFCIASVHAPKVKNGDEERRVDSKAFLQIWQTLESFLSEIDIDCYLDDYEADIKEYFEEYAEKEWEENTDAVWRLP